MTGLEFVSTTVTLLESTPLYTPNHLMHLSMTSGIPPPPFGDVLGGEVEHILIQIEEQWGDRKVFVDLQDRDMPDMSINITAQSEQFKEQSGYVSPICLMLQGPIPDCIRPQP